METQVDHAGSLELGLVFAQPLDDVVSADTSTVSSAQTA
jgi:hypothetical protein